MANKETKSSSESPGAENVRWPRNRPVSSSTLPIVDLDEEFDEVEFLLSQGVHEDAEWALDELASRGGEKVTAHPRYREILAKISGEKAPKEAADKDKAKKEKEQPNKQEPAKREAATKLDAKKGETQKPSTDGNGQKKEKPSMGGSKPHISETSPLGKRLAKLKKAATHHPRKEKPGHKAKDTAAKKSKGETGAKQNEAPREALGAKQPEAKSTSPGDNKPDSGPAPLPPPPVTEEPDFDIDATDVAFPMEKSSKLQASKKPDFLGMDDSGALPSISPAQEAALANGRDDSDAEDEEPTAVVTDEEPTRQRTPSIPPVPGSALSAPAQASAGDEEPTAVTIDEEPTRQRPPSIPPVPGMALSAPTNQNSNPGEPAPVETSVPPTEPLQAPSAPLPPPPAAKEGALNTEQVVASRPPASLPNKRNWRLWGGVGGGVVLLLVILLLAWPKHEDKSAKWNKKQDEIAQSGTANAAVGAKQAMDAGPSAESPKRDASATPTAEGTDAPTPGRDKAAHDASLPSDAAVSKVVLTVIVDPPEAAATIRFRGKKFRGHRFVSAPIESSSASEKILVEAPGYKSRIIEITLSKSIEQRVELTPETPRPRTRNPRRPHGRRRHRRRRKPRSRLIGLD